MATFTFTKREATFVKRFIQIHAEEFARDFELKTKMDSDTFNHAMEHRTDDRNNYIFVGMRCPTNIVVSLVIAYEHCNDDDDTINMKSLKPFIRVLKYQQKYNDTELHIRPFIMESDEWVDTLIKTYQFCDCCPNVLAVKDGYCRQCFPLVMEQDDVCCICHHNVGVWVKLECGHIMHQGCFRKIDYYKNNRVLVRKCPLCRKEMPVNTEELL